MEEQQFDSDDLTLHGYYARPAGSMPLPAAVVVPGFPRGTGGAATATHVYRSLVERIPSEVSWAAFTWWFRGTGPCRGSFSIDGWQRDLAAAVDHVRARADVTGVWLVGFRLGGTLSVLHAARDPLVRGLATFAAPASLRAWVRDPAWFHSYCERVGVLRDETVPGDVQAWARAIESLEPLGAARTIDRPWLLVHGSDDDTVPVEDARRYAEANPIAELRIVSHGAHRLRHDPRAVAALVGWLDRQAP